MRSLLSLAAAALTACTTATAQLPVEGTMPPLSGATAWLNTPPLTAKALRGKVVLIDFWTYSCVNCLRALPYVKAWDAKYRSKGLVVIGVHAPEFAFEHDSANVRRSLRKLGITYPVALDNDMAIWNAFHNAYWPAHYFVDAQGRIRYHHFGEGGYEESERVIRELLAEASAGHGGHTPMGADTTGHVVGHGVLAAPDFKDVRSPETYVGYKRAERMAPGQRVARDATATYTIPAHPALNAWGLGGAWQVAGEAAEAKGSKASLRFRFHARDLNLVLGTAAQGKPIRFRITIDGHAPGADAGSDVSADGVGTVTEHRLYQLVRQRGAVGDHTFTITFDEAGVQAYAFTFG